MAQMSPFQLFGMKPAFMIDEAKLEAAYQAAMMKVHPDRFADRPAAERRVAEQWSTRINEAFKLLKNPVPGSARTQAVRSRLKPTPVCPPTSS